MIDLDSIRARNEVTYAPPMQVFADRRALLAYVDELRAAVSEALEADESYDHEWDGLKERERRDSAFAALRALIK